MSLNLTCTYFVLVLLEKAKAPGVTPVSYLLFGITLVLPLVCASQACFESQSWWKSLHYFSGLCPKPSLIVPLNINDALLKPHLCFCWAELAVLVVSFCLVQSQGFKNHFLEINLREYKASFSLSLYFVLMIDILCHGCMIL